MGGMSVGSGLVVNGNVNGDSGEEDEKIFSLVIDLMDPVSREGALLELSKKREQYDDLALVLWHSFGECSIWWLLI
jgi:CCR4-NOT transcription complex subunit 9